MHVVHFFFRLCLPMFWLEPHSIATESLGLPFLCESCPRLMKQPHAVASIVLLFNGPG